MDINQAIAKINAETNTCELKKLVEENERTFKLPQPPFPKEYILEMNVAALKRIVAICCKLDTAQIKELQALVARNDVTLKLPGQPLSKEYLLGLNVTALQNIVSLCCPDICNGTPSAQEPPAAGNQASATAGTTPPAADQGFSTQAIITLSIASFFVCVMCMFLAWLLYSTLYPDD